MEELLKNVWISALVVLLFQIIFVYLRTINVIHTAERRTFAAMLSGALSGLFWLFSMTIGVASIMEGKWLPILAHLIGGAIGTYWGIQAQIKRDLKILEP